MRNRYVAQPDAEKLVEFENVAVDPAISDFIYAEFNGCVVDTTVGHCQPPIAYCDSYVDAIKIADALNAAEERRQVAKLREAELARRT